MKIKSCNAVVVEKDIYGSRDIFFEEDIVSIQYGDEENPQVVTGRIIDVFDGGAWFDNNISFIKLDESTQYYQRISSIRVSDIISIIKNPD